MIASKEMYIARHYLKKEMDTSNKQIKIHCH